VTCKNCGKQWSDGARGFDADKRACVNTGPCLERALGPSRAKSEAKRRHRADQLTV
jgi:hypothetical protein